MNISELSIRRPVFAWILFSAFIVFGAISYQRLGISMMPDVDFPVLTVSTVWEGAAPDVIESELVDKIEERVIGLEGLKDVRSSIRQGRATVTLEYDLNRDLDAALQDTQGALSQLRLPTGVDVPTIKKTNPEDEPIMWIAFGGDRPLHDLIRFAELNVIDQLQTVSGVGEVMLGGYTSRNLRLWIDKTKLQRYQLSILDLVDAIEKEHREEAGGYIENQKNEINVRTMGEGLTAEEVGNFLITRRGGQPIYDTTIRVRDVARVEDGLADIRNAAYISGQKGAGISIGIKKQRKTNEIKVADGVVKKLEELSKRLPKDLSIRVNVDFTEATRDSVHETQFELILSVLLTTLICFLFLGTWKAALNVILSIPFSVVGTFIVIYFMGFTLNLFTLLALTLAIGIVVDDAIMMLENIVRHFAMGKSRRRAAGDGATEITFAAIAASVAVVAIFLPVIFMEGIIGKFFFQFGIVISAAVMLSLVEAVTITPMRCSQLMAPNDHDGWLAKKSDSVFFKLAAVYQRTLEFSLKARWLVVISATLIFVASCFIVRALRIEYIPPIDQNFIRGLFQTPVGSSLEMTTQVAKEVRAYLDKHPDVKRYFIRVGGNDGVPNQCFAAITLKDKSERVRGHVVIMQEMRKDLGKIKGLTRVQLRDISDRGLTGGGRSNPLSFNIRGPDYSVLKTKSKEMMDGLNESKLVVDLDTDYREGQPELRIIPDREAAALRGVSMETISRTINTAIGGVRQGKFSSDGRRYDIRIRLTPEQRLQPEEVNDLMLRTAYGELVPLKDVARIEVVKTVQSISRVNRSKSISVFGGIAPGQSQAVALQKVEELADKILPEGYSIHFEGAAQTFVDSIKSLWFALLLGVIVAYMVLAVQFNSFIHPVTVLLALPFSLTGAFATLFLTNQSLNVFSMIGLLLLMGIVKKNSILLVEFANHMRGNQKADSKLALLKACPIRLRPILMTSMATIGAAIPPAMGWGQGAELRQPMALAIIGGVIVSTLFTLYVVPCAYLIFSRFERPEPADDGL
ncbi:MAG: efflux RND transporter permease subunit [Verrucomicrobiota bacterium]|nr:efflux RND transporter permease subunit [Verrucomicrobiota bacterium]